MIGISLIGPRRVLPLTHFKAGTRVRKRASELRYSSLPLQLLEHSVCLHQTSYMSLLIDEMYPKVAFSLLELPKWTELAEGRVKTSAVFSYASSNAGGYSGWAWIFILEGLATILLSIGSFWVIQDFPDNAKFLSETERMTPNSHPEYCNLMIFLRLLKGSL